MRRPKTSLYISVFDFERHDKISMYANRWKDNKTDIQPDPKIWMDNENNWERRQVLTKKAESDFISDESPAKMLITTAPLFDESAYETRSFCNAKGAETFGCQFFVYQPR